MAVTSKRCAEWGTGSSKPKITMKKEKKLLYQLFPSYFFITVISLIAVSWYAMNFTHKFFMERTRTNLEVSGRLLETQMTRLLNPLDASQIDQLCKEAASKTVTRLTVILPNGKVVGDSEKPPDQMQNHLDRVEVREAYQGQVGVSIRYSDTLKQDMMYVAIPLQGDQALIGVLRTSMPLTAINERISTIRSRIAMGLFFVILLSSGFSWFVSKRITAPIEEMREGAKRFAQGDLSHRLPALSTRELSGLAETMNRMAEQLQQRLDQISTQRKRTEAVLSSMREGVIATDMDQRVMRINPAAAKMFAVRRDTASGRSVLEIIRSNEFQELLNQCLSSGESIESDVVYYQNGERIFNVHCSPLLDPSQERMGGLVVLSDVTQLRQLESIRRDFAASVSHEIKTPLTAIKGFVETLCTSDLEDSEQTRRFLTIIDKHANRLATIIEDLMQLSRIESGDEIQQIGFERHQISDVLNTVIGICRTSIEAKNIDVKLQCDPNLSGFVDPTLLEQALVNLLDNAIKYSPEKSAVLIDAQSADNEIQIHFVDQGIGISKKHLPRLFERFYRVDKARSRKMGGTGLGLAIVKHIAQAHGGNVTVVSELGKGSTFTLHLPIEKQA
jgi:two-component system phosphate regulon sensor histidine kinase PhoR